MQYPSLNTLCAMALHWPLTCCADILCRSGFQALQSLLVSLIALCEPSQVFCSCTANNYVPYLWLFAA